VLYLKCLDTRGRN